ncbi:hypothetical protein ABZT02_07280 [Streptomyces sp. NPDC005402]|uniref:hypothetical protein n=1 Tax=Streptomyces sp. NPDC005402 TaxID=3155338 RepID=UPI0033A8DB5C
MTTVDPACRTIFHDSAHPAPSAAPLRDITVDDQRRDHRPPPVQYRPVMGRDTGAL